jgi:phosphatidylethanolamine/phosphatidyl-N-methylethanolamine N-methyltransferase
VFQLFKLLRFLGEAIKHFGRTGALTPSSVVLARTVSEKALATAPDSIELIEFGPGTGAITRLLLQRTVRVIEIDTEFANMLRMHFPLLDVVEQSAEDFLLSLRQPVSIVTSIPVIGNPQAPQFISALKTARENGFIQQITTYTYGRRSPLEEVGFTTAWRSKKVWWNLPPATVWHYEN